MKNTIIRQVTSEDYEQIYRLIKTAFESAEHRDGEEQDFAARLRERSSYLPELELVAEYEGQLVGHIMFTETYVKMADGGCYRTLMVAPLSVLLEMRNSGVGSALMKEGLKRASQIGYQTAFLCGDPAYYQRLGYRHAYLHSITHKSIPEQYVMVYEMKPGSLSGITGIIKLE